MSLILSSRVIAHRIACNGLGARRCVQSPQRLLGLSQEITLRTDQLLRDLQQTDRFCVGHLLRFEMQRLRFHAGHPAAESATEHLNESLPAWGLVKVRYIVAAGSKSYKCCAAGAHVVTRLSCLQDESSRPSCERSDRVSEQKSNSNSTLFVWYIVADHGPDDKETEQTQHMGSKTGFGYPNMPEKLRRKSCGYRPICAKNRVYRTRANFDPSRRISP